MILDINRRSKRYKKKCRKVKTVTLNGEDVTRRCTYLDTRRGIVVLFAVDENEDYILDLDRPKKVRLNGKVRVTFQK